ncbi:MAG: hypothetical protein SPM31_02485 [Prevotella sp.]|nr:hypothetical protein [Prevotella sp.]
MKKTLLAMSALMVAASGFAQTSVVSASASKAVLPRMNVRFQAQRADQPAPAVRRSASTGLYFTAPEGSFYQGYGLDGSGLYVTKVIVPLDPASTFTKTGTGSWRIEGMDQSAAGDLSFTLPFGSGFFYGPSLVQGTDSFCLGTNNIYTKLYDTNDSRIASFRATLDEISAPLHWGLIGPDSTTTLLYVTDDHGSYLSKENKYYTNGAAYGFLDSNYLFGSGNVDNDGDGTMDYTCTSIQQYMGKTTAPLYVENIVTEGRTKVEAGPLTNGAVLTAYVCGVTTAQRRDGSTMYVADLDDVLDTLTAEAADTLDFKTNEDDGYGTFYVGHLVFSKKVVDEFGTPTNEPFVIPANKQFCIVVSGLDQAGVSYGIDGLAMQDDADADRQGGYFDVKNTKGDHYDAAFTFQDKIAAKIALNGMYDGARSPEHPGFYTFEDPSLSYNTVKISDDGQSCLTKGATASYTDNGAGLPGAWLQTVIPFESADGTQNYSVQGLPDWVTGVNVDVINEKDKKYKQYVVNFTATALPAGTTKRAAAVYVVSDKGAVSNPIYLLQGDATVADGISSASVETVGNKADFRTYNLAGQRVNASYKGVVIANGKKYLQK